VKKRLVTISFTPRQKALAVVALAVAVVALVMDQWTFPAYDSWLRQASVLEAKVATHERLSRNLLMKDRVEEQFGLLPPETFRQETDEMMFADLLQRVEAAAGPLLMKINPSPPKDEGAYATYRVRLLLSGKLQEIVGFIDTLTAGDAAVGVESFTLRAIPGRNMCDCTFVLWMVRLTPPRQQAEGSPATTAPAATPSTGSR